MPDLKAAAQWLRETAGNYLTAQEREHNEIAAQALEAWAWQQETGASVRQTTGGEFWCAVKLQGHQLTNNYYADTPLGAVLAAMAGESESKNGEENDRQTQDNKCIG